MGVFSTQFRNAVLYASLAGSALGYSGTAYAKLHLGDPGSLGTANPAAENHRHAVTIAAPSGGAATNLTDIDWAGVAATETITYVSFWDSGSVSGGNFIGSDDLPTPRAVAAGDTFRIQAGSVTFSL